MSSVAQGRPGPGGRNFERQLTLIAYLSGETDPSAAWPDDGLHGGETSFPELGVRVAPKCGRLLVWKSLTPDGTCDFKTIHEAKPLRGGAPKRILQRWYTADVNPMGNTRAPPPSHMAGFDGHQTHVHCLADGNQASVGQLPTRCREAEPVTDFRPFGGGR